MSRKSIKLSPQQFDLAVRILTKLEKEEKKPLRTRDCLLNPRGEMSFSEIKKALIFSQKTTEAIFIEVEPTHNGKNTLTKKPFRDPLLPPHLHSLHLVQGRIPNCWFLSALNSILIKSDGSKIIASLMIDLELKILVDKIVYSLGKLLGFFDDKKVMVRLIKEGIPRYCIVDKTIVTDLNQSYSEFYIQAIVKAHVGLFFEGDYAKVRRGAVNEGYQTLLFTRVSSLKVFFSEVYKEVCERFENFSSPLDKTEETNIFNDKKNLISAFNQLLKKIHETKALIPFTTTKFSAAIKKSDMILLGISETDCDMMLSNLKKYEDLIKSETKFRQAFSKKILRLIEDSSNGATDSYPMCLAITMGLNNELISEEGIVNRHAFTLDKIIHGVEFHDQDTKSVIKTDVIWIKNPWGNKRRCDQSGELVDISDGRHGIGIKNAGGKLKFFDSHESTSQVTLDYILHHFYRIIYVKFPINAHAAKELSQQSINHLEAFVKSGKNVTDMLTQQNPYVIGFNGIFSLFTDYIHNAQSQKTQNLEPLYSPEKKLESR